ARLEVHHHGAGPVLVRSLWQPGEGEVAAVAVELADARHQVEQVGLGTAAGLVATRALRPSALLPAAPLVADESGRHQVLPLDARRPLRVLARSVAAAAQVHALAAVAAAAVELERLWGIQAPGDLLGFGEGARRGGERLGGKGE